MKKLILILLSVASFAAACGDSSGRGDSAAYCDLSKQAEAAQGELDDGDFGPESLEAAFTGMYELTQAAVKVVPSEIKADMETMNAWAGNVVAGLEAADWDITAADSDVLALFEDAGFNEASERVDAWDQANCG